MELIAFGGDARVNGLLRAARKNGFSCMHVTVREELEALPQRVRAVALPWPRSFSGGLLAQTTITKEMLLARLPACDVLLGGGIETEDVPRAQRLIDPSKDESLLMTNAKITAEGTVAELLKSGSGMMMGKTCLITGFGRIAQALTRRLAALDVFVIVCARNEGQMQLAHRMGAHPVPLRQIASAGAQADIVVNTVPARVFTAESLVQMRPGVRFIELASAPYGADPEQAAQLGVSMEILGGLPGKYAPEEAGAALFDVLRRAMCDGEREEK